MTEQERKEKMLKKSEIILAAGGEKRIKKQHTCKGCFWYYPEYKWCVEGGVKIHLLNLSPDTPACRKYDE